MTALSEFLLARIAEDEAAARHSLDGDIEYLPSLTTKRGDVLYLGVTHPTRVLAECEAKRQIITRFQYASSQADTWSEPNAATWGDSPSEVDSWEKIAGALELCCQSLALIYVDHPDYLPEWNL